MDRDALTARLRRLFLDELDEHVGLLNQGLLTVERQADGPPPAAVVQQLFRSAHSLKGAAHSAGVAPVEALCHRLESVLATVRDQAARPDPTLVEALFLAVDAVDDAGRRLRRGVDPDDLDLDEAVDALIDATTTAAGVAPPPTRSATASASAPAPPPAAAPPPPPPVDDRPVEALLRIPAAKLDALLASAGELLTASARVEALARAVTRSPEVLPAEDVARQAARLERDLRRTGDGLTEAIRAARVRPFHEACDGLDRVARDVARDVGKQVALTIEGGDEELDRALLDALREPLLHLVRNAIAHGIEPPGVRAAAGKPPTGHVRVAAALRDGGVEVSVADDGAGVDRAAVVAAAARRGVGVGDTDEELFDALFAPGLSTASQLTELSGRGVGLDAVRHRVEALGGAVRARSAPGPGLRISLDLPLTLSGSRVVLVEVAGETVALAQPGIVRLVRAPAEAVHVAEGRDVLLLDGQAIPVVALADALGFEAAAPTGATIPAVLVAGPSGASALVVDELVGEDDVLLKRGGGRLDGVPGLLGAAVLADGRPVLVLNGATCARVGLTRRPARRRDASPEAPAPAARVLLAEDTTTTRVLERMILEGAGYRVEAVADGAAAWQALNQAGADLVVSDVDMPVMDGFELCAAIRRSPRFADLPVVLVTSLATDEDRARGVDVGADAYIVKADFEQRALLEAIGRLL